MARAGISEFHVFQAADSLKAQNINPTVDNVRRELGDTGSRTTINNHLRLWREQNEHRGRSAEDLSVSLQQILGEQSKSILQALEAEAEEKFRSQRERHELQLQMQTAELEAVKAQLRERDQAITELQTVRENQQQEIMALQSALADARDESQTLRENRASLQATVTHLHKQLQDIQAKEKHAQKALEALRADQLKLREGDQRKHRAELDALRAKIEDEKRNQVIQAARLRDLESQIPSMQADLKKAGGDSLRVRNEAQAAVRHAEESRLLMEAERKALKKILDDRDHEINELKQTIQELRRQDQQRLSELVSAVAALGNKIEGGSATPTVKANQPARKVPAKLSRKTTG